MQSYRGQNALFSKFSLTDRVAVVTGGGNGIGKGIAMGFAEAGADIAVVEMIAEKGEATSEEIRVRGRKALPLSVDVTSEGEVEKMVDTVMTEFGRIDILVNVVGGTRGAKKAPVMNTELAVWNLIIDLNMKSTFLCSKMVSRVMVKQKSGNIINIVSGAGLRPYPNQMAYGAAKAGMINFTQSLAVQLAPYNIRANAIAPGITITPGASYLGDPDERAITIRGILRKRAGRVEDIAYAAVFLASDASDYITGHTLPVMGGMYQGLRMLEEAERDWKL